MITNHLLEYILSHTINAIDVLFLDFIVKPTNLQLIHIGNSAHRFLKRHTFHLHKHDPLK